MPLPLPVPLSGGSELERLQRPYSEAPEVLASIESAGRARESAPLAMDSINTDADRHRHGCIRQ
jgi:hypothetical protein